MGNNISPAPSPSPTPHHNPKLASFGATSSLALREHSTTRRPRILCLDGGGMRGIIEAEFLKEIEKRSGKKIGDLFDLICGTSTGGLLSCAMVYKAMTGTDAEKMYKNVGKEIFTRGGLAKISSLSTSNELYDVSNYEKILKSIVGENSKLNSVTYPYAFVVATDYTNPNALKSVVLSNYSADFQDWDVWEALRATSAATIYFQNFQKGDKTYQDGGFLANNPTELAMDECCVLWPDLPPATIVSIGTGLYLGTDDIPQRKVSVSSLVSNTIQEALKIATSSELIHERVKKQLQNNPRYGNTEYFRLNVDMPESYPLDITDEATLTLLQNLVVRFVAENETEICKLVASLTSE